MLVVGVIVAVALVARGAERQRVKVQAQSREEEMVIATYDTIDAYVTQSIASSGPTASTIYDQRLLDSTFPNHQYVPHCIYFFYIRVNGNGALKVDHYFYFKGPPDDPMKWEKLEYNDVINVEGIIKQLALNARPSGVKNPAPLPDHNFANIILRRKSYVVFFLDEANWAFHKQSGGRFAMAFNEGKSGNQPNHSFFDGHDLEIQMPIFGTQDEDTRTGVLLVNHMKSDAVGTDLVMGEEPEFAFDMYFDVEFADPSSQRLTVIFDPGGTNQGPPEIP